MDDKAVVLVPDDCVNVGGTDEVTTTVMGGIGVVSVCGGVIIVVEVMN